MLSSDRYYFSKSVYWIGFEICYFVLKVHKKALHHVNITLQKSLKGVTILFFTS